MKSVWKIVELKSKVGTKVVFNVTAIISYEIDGESDRSIQSMDFDGDPTSPSFIPFEQLTEEIVIGWVKQEMGAEKISIIEAEMKASIEDRIYKKAHPEFISKIPWKNNNLS